MRVSRDLPGVVRPIIAQCLYQTCMRGRAEQAIEDLTLLGVIRHPHVDLLGRAWELRGSVTPNDAMYLALAEALDAPLVTCDRPLGATPGHGARVEVIR